LVEEPEGRRLFGETQIQQEDNMKMKIREIECKDVNFTEYSHGRLCGCDEFTVL
jgi:hypothetical protein